MKIPIKILALVLIVLFESTNIYGSTITSAQSSNATAGSTWVGGVVPGATDNVIIASGHIVTLTSASYTTNGSFTVSGTLQLSSSSMTLGDLQGNGIITMSSGTGTLTIGSNNSSTTFSGVIGTGAIALTKNGTGVLTLSGSNTYTGVTTITAGTIKLGNPVALGSALSISGDYTVINSGAVLDLNGTNYSSTEFLRLNGTGISGGGALINSSGTTATYAGKIDLYSASTITT